MKCKLAVDGGDLKVQEYVLVMESVGKISGK